MLCRSLGREVICFSLQHFIALALGVMPYFQAQGMRDCNKGIKYKSRDILSQILSLGHLYVIKMIGKMSLATKLFIGLWEGIFVVSCIITYPLGAQ